LLQSKKKLQSTQTKSTLNKSFFTPSTKPKKSDSNSYFTSTPNPLFSCSSDSPAFQFSTPFPKSSKNKENQENQEKQESKGNVTFSSSIKNPPLLPSQKKIKY